MLSRHPVILASIGSAHAHLQLAYPAPFNASNNPHRTTAADPFLQYPYDCCGPGARWQYPCRGYHSLLGTLDGQPTATWEPGSQQNWSMTGIGNHYGGSCQVGFSVDGGETFRVSTSYEGNCPHRDAGNGPEGQGFTFTVPHDLPAGVQLFAWTWFNREQEFNMNCAAVNITATTNPSTNQGGPGGYEQPTTIVDASDSTSITSSSSQSPTYKTANGLTCTCKDPHNISTCDCACSDDSTANHRRDNAGSNSKADAASSPGQLPFSSRPTMLVADDGNGCVTPKTDAELKFPESGPDVVTGDGVYPLRLPEGDCGGYR